MSSVPGVYQVDIQKTAGGNYWSNRYFVQAGTLAEAAVRAKAIADIERLAYPNDWNMAGLRASTILPHDNAFISVPDNRPGGGGPSNGQMLPLFACKRLLFGVGPRRPNVKYYKGMGEFEQGSGIWVEGNRTAFIALVGQPLVNLGYICDRNGHLWLTVDADSKVGMRQLRRGSKRKKTPIIPNPA